MSEHSERRRLLGPGLKWSALILVCVGVLLAYRWADPGRTGTGNRGSAASSVMIRLENTPFSGYSRGFKTWTLWARQIDIDRQPGAGMSNIQAATLTDIRDGVLYPSAPSPSAPSPSASAPTASSVASALSASTASTAPLADRSVSSAQSSSTSNAALTNVRDISPDPETTVGSPVATFSAQHGRYSALNTDPMPPELAPLYMLQWQLRLTGNVTFQTSQGETLRAESLVVLDLMSRRGARAERRVICDNGAHVTLKGSEIEANQARYDFRSRTVECLGGARGTFKDSAVQADSLFWSLADQMVRSPDVSSGTMMGAPFTAEGLTLDLKRRIVRANHMKLDLRNVDKN